MTAEEFRAVRARLGLTDDALAAELGLAPSVVRAWAAGTLGIPGAHAQALRWRAALAEREEALVASGLSECETVRRLEGELAGGNRGALASLGQHFAAGACPACRARAQYVHDRFGPMPEPPRSGASRLHALLQRAPWWVRPIVLGSLALLVLSALRLLFASSAP